MNMTHHDAAWPLTHRESEAGRPESPAPNEGTHHEAAGVPARMAYTIGHGTLWSGDCREVLADDIPAGSVDLIVTSPPYNVSVPYDHWDDAISMEEYEAFILECLHLFKRVLKPDGRFAINVMLNANAKREGVPNRLSPAALFYHLVRQAGLGFHTFVVLYEDANGHRTHYSAWGSWLNQSSPYIYTPLEVGLLGYNKQWKKQHRRKDTDLDKETFIGLVKGYWPYVATTRQLTPANYSVDFPCQAIKILTYPGETVLDPFMGSGTTAIAAEMLDRRWLGAEISPNYAAKAAERIQAFVNSQSNPSPQAAGSGHPAQAPRERSCDYALHRFSHMVKRRDDYKPAKPKSAKRGRGRSHKPPRSEASEQPDRGEANE